MMPEPEPTVDESLKAAGLDRLGQNERAFRESIAHLSPELQRLQLAAVGLAIDPTHGEIDD